MEEASILAEFKQDATPRQLEKKDLANAAF